MRVRVCMRVRVARARALPSEHVLLMTFSTLASHVQWRGSAPGAPHQPARVVEYHIPPVLPTIGQLQHIHGSLIHRSQLQRYEEKLP